MAGSDGSITPSVGPVPHQASGSSSPGSHSLSGGSRHPVSALKKWLTNPVRKLSSDARGGTGKVEKQMYKSDRKQPPSLLSHSETQPRPLEPQINYTILLSPGDTVGLTDRHIHATFVPPTLTNTFYIPGCNGCFACVVQVGKDGLLSPEAPTQPPCQSYLSDLLQGRDTQSLVMSLFYSVLLHSIQRSACLICSYHSSVTPAVTLRTHSIFQLEAKINFL